MTHVSHAQVENIENSGYKNLITLQIAYPSPNSGSTFNRIYDGLIDIRVVYARSVSKFFFGGDFGYTEFKVNKNVLDKTGTISILSPGIALAYKYDILKCLNIQTALKISYDFFKFGGSVNNNSVISYSYDGMALMPEISINYFINNNFGLGLAGSYKTIFKHFGNQAVYEESTTRIILAGIKLSYLL